MPPKVSSFCPQGEHRGESRMASMAPGADHGMRGWSIRGRMVRKFSPLLAEKRSKERRQCQLGNLCRTELARFPAWTGAGKARDELSSAHRISHFLAQHCASRAVFQGITS
jgi:hypothetical protein